jgi:2-methylcitrate dehydratase PrpD
MTGSTPHSIAEQLACFAERLSYDEIPASARAAARHLMLDGVGIAFAASTRDFARSAAAALAALEPGEMPAIAMPGRYALRDAALLDGVLIHGLDYDDTHLVGVVHATASCLPAALTVAAREHRSGRDLLTAYVLGMEVAGRLGAVAKGEMNQVGFHPTGVVAAFATALAAGKLWGLDERQLVMAQGIVLSMASGTREYSTDGAWSKRLHPGWAASCGITAAALARTGFTGPRTAYEGRFGLFATHLGALGGSADLPAATAALGTQWEVERVAIKPFPACQLSIACIDAAIGLHRQHRLAADQIEAVEAVIPPHAVNIVCEPVAAKLRPRSDYAAQFSLQFCIACALLRGRFGLAELERITDPDILELAAKVTYRADHDTDYPLHFPGEVIVITRDGRRLTQREAINLGAPDRPVPPADIERKFFENAGLAVAQPRAEQVRDLLLSIDRQDDAATCAQALAEPSTR